MPTQEEKYAVAMAGEHFVAAELLRRGVAASVTMGNAKRADVVVMNREATKAVIVEVKSSTRNEWVVGNTIPKSSNQPWVFVHVPSEGSSPRYFVFTAKELVELLSPGDLAYRARYESIHKTPFIGKGVVKLALTAAASGEGRWEKIIERVS